MRLSHVCPHRGEPEGATETTSAPARLQTVKGHVTELRCRLRVLNYNSNISESAPLILFV